jgi:hypothetical protein
MMRNWIIVGVLGVVGVGGVVAVVGGESASETVKRTQQYTTLLGKAQAAQEKLQAFIDGQQKACTAKGRVLNMSAQGLLACVDAPKPQAQPPAPPSK